MTAEIQTLGGPAPSFRDRFAASLRGFGPTGLLVILIIAAGVVVAMPLAAALILLWAWLSQTPWRDIGYVRPKSWLGGLVIGVLFGVAFKFAMKAVVMPLLGADPINHVYHYMAGNLAATAIFAAYSIVGAGWGEETVFRGYLFERLGKLLGSGFAAKSVIVILTTAIFASLHYQQGLPGIEQAMITGGTFAIIFAVTGRLYTLMVAHAAFDLAAAAIIYLNLETTVAHLVFP
jgi:membrane protease YdiL (CAAX protease family)